MAVVPKVVSSKPQKVTRDVPGAAPKVSSGQIRKLRRQIRKLKTSQTQAAADPYKAQIAAATQEKFGAAERNLVKQARASRQQQSRSDAWYDEYRQQVAQAGAQSAAAYGQAAAASQAQAGAADAQSQAASQQALQAAQADAASRGATVAPSMATTAAQAAASRNVAAASGTDVLRSSGAAQAGLSAGQGLAGAAAKLSARRDEGGRRRSIAEDMQLLKQQKGAYKVQARGELESAASKAALEAQVFGLDVAKEQNDVAESAADRAADNRNKAADRKAKGQDVNSWGYTASEWTAMDPTERQNIIKTQKGWGAKGKGSKGSDGPTVQQAKDSRTAITNVNTIVAKWDAYAKSGVPVTKIVNVKDGNGKVTGQRKITVTNPDGTPKLRKPSPDQIRAELLKKYDATAIHIALMVRANKPLSPRDRRLAKQLGILKIPTGWKRGKSTYTGATNSSGGRGPQGLPG